MYEIIKKVLFKNSLYERAYMTYTDTYIYIFFFRTMVS